MGDDDPRWLVVGQIRKPHGVRGEVYVHPLTDHPEGVFSPGVVLHRGGSRGNDPDPDLAPLRVETVRPFRTGYLVLFGGMLDRNDAELVRDQYLMRELEQLAPLADDELFYHQLLGMSVETVGGAEVGRVREVYELQPSDLLEVRTRSGNVLIPFHRSVVVEVDREGRRLIIDPPDGLLEL